MFVLALGCLHVSRAGALTAWPLEQLLRLGPEKALPLQLRFAGLWSRTTSGTSSGSARPDSKVSISLRRWPVRFVRYAVSKLRRAPTAAVR